MADEAGPSGAGTGKASPEALQEAEHKFERGIQCIRVRGSVQNGMLPHPGSPGRRRHLPVAICIRPHPCSLLLARAPPADQRPGAGCAAVC